MIYPKIISKETALRFFKFGIIGTLGMTVDSLVLLFGTKILLLDPYTARIISYLAAATTTWLGNRMFTFSDRPKSSFAKQWMVFVMLNAIGFAINYSFYALLVSQFAYIYANPVWGVAAGSLVGMVFNYVASTRFIFKAT